MNKRIFLPLWTAVSLLAAGGSAGGGGGTGGGGGGSTSSCSPVSSFSVSSSRSPYGSPLADVKVAYTLKACTAGFSPQTTIIVTNVSYWSRGLVGALRRVQCRDSALWQSASQHGIPG